MLEVYERAYRLYVVTYKIRYAKCFSAETSCYRLVLYSTRSRQYRKWSRDRKWSPKWTANDPRPQVIPKVDRKWSRENLRNGMDFMGLITKMDWLLKRNLFLSPSKEKGKEDATSQVNLYKVKKKNGINLKRVWYSPYTSFFVRIQFSFKNVSSLKNLRQAGRYAEKTLLIF